nr:hypothetical protein [Tanacetum cinerariifolium]GEZ42226.1 hypothetical protein [Tanacetum cinerariifolium]
MDIEDEMDDPEIINPYEIEEGELPPPPANSDTSSDSEPEVEAEDEDEDEAAIVGTINHALYSVQLFLGTTYMGSGSSRKVFAPDPIERMSTFCISVSTLEDQMRGLMLEDKEEKERLKKKLRASQQEKEQIEQAFHHMIDWIRKQFRVEIPPCMVPTEKKKVEEYIKGLPKNIKGEVNSSRPVNLNEAVRMDHTLMKQKIQAKAERIAKGNKRKWKNSHGVNRNNNNKGNYQDNTRHHQYNNQRQGNARALTNAPAEQDGYKGNKPLCNNCKKHNITTYKFQQM